MTNTKTYKLSKLKQLIDLNGDLTNFDVSFTAKSKNGEHFEALIVDQQTLDNTEFLDYKQAKGIISGNFISDQNVYQNYFLILRSDKNCECDVTIDIKEIPPKLIQETNQNTNNQTNEQNNVPVVVPEKSNINWKIILIIVVILGLAAILYSKFNSSKNKEEGDLLSSLKSIEKNDNSFRPSFSNLKNNFNNSTNSTNSINDINENLISKINNMII